MTPAFAVISKLKEQGASKFVWVGHKYNQAGSRIPSAEFQTVIQMGIPFVDLRAGKLSRNWDDLVSGAMNLLKIPWGFVHSFFIILKYQPDMILSFGGYLALPIVVMGKLLGKKVITHEQTVVSGLTNRIIPRFADKILISWPSSAKFYPPSKTVLTGNPLRPEIFNATSNAFALDQSLPTIYITGGNQGSHKINQAIFDKLPDILQVANVIHQTGNSSITGDAEKSKQLQSQLPEELRKRYFPLPFIFGEQIGEVFAKSDLVISRAGANTTYELLALGKLCIFIPIPWVTHNEQQLNAEIAAGTGLGTIVKESELTASSLFDRIVIGLNLIKSQQGFNSEPIATCRQKAQSLVKRDAANLIVQEVMQLLQ
jgi:UDP-N-acetylglucosamine--N-acetylmuramyl-(pentapeptide) pyrophosphoryl-undecaprenol N-acetylglucosamine transferase